MRVVAAACVWLALWAWASMLQGWAAAGAEEMQWRRVVVEESWFKKSVLQTSQQLSSVTLCGAACMRHDWCRLWCRTAPTHCLLTSLIVSGSYQPSEAHDALTCYTSRESEMAFGANITSSPGLDYGLPKNLVGGVYTNHFRSSSLVTSATESGGAWFLVDLGVSRTISEVLLIPHLRSGTTSKRFQDIEVKVGDVQEAGNFTSYTLLGTFKGPGMDGQEVTLRPHASITGRYVSIQRTSSGYLQIGHLEIR
ncbi:uncharacterized protein LOC126996097 [Eriocheir sinensis]|uniref:uncharacterized protein LOC126996097 n=1 Tax=Eriocheir sinensis TaxID=95602 RepID=UPI0021C7A8A9|nr:uncharacterized protein LOC126996097 [Eriocheir sinensis]